MLTKENYDTVNVPITSDLAIAAYSWWAVCRPESYSLLDHLNNPTVNKQPKDTALCTAVAEMVKAHGVPTDMHLTR